MHTLEPTVIADDDVADLGARVAGPVLPGDHPGVAAEVATFNLAVTHRPALVVGATSADDVAAAVGWAAERGLPVAVQATGHGPVRPVSDAVLVTTSRMTSVEIDAADRTAVVGAGARWRDLLAAAAPYGLAGVGGSSTQVGVVGFCVGGGIGPLSRQFGFGADLVRSLEVVTADGRVRRVDEQREPDLFWAICGGKGNFGIVTSLRLDLVPVAQVYGGAVFFSATSARDVLHSFRAWAPTLPDHAGASLALLRLPPVETLPEPIRGRYVVHLRFSVNGSEAEGAALLAPMLESGEVLLSGVGALPVTAIDAIHQDPQDPLPAWERGALLSALTAEAVDRLLQTAGPESGSPLAMVELRLMGGALGRQPRVPNAVSGREGAFSLLTLGMLTPELEQLVPRAGAAVHAALSPWLTGTVPVNWLGDAATPEQVGRAWRPEVHARLLRVKQQVDPENLFRFGHALGLSSGQPRHGRRRHIRPVHRSLLGCAGAGARRGRTGPAPVRRRTPCSGRGAPVPGPQLRRHRRAAAELAREADLVRVESSRVTIEVPFESFQAWWKPSTRGVGSGGAYVRRLAEPSSVSDGMPPAAVRAYTSRLSGPQTPRQGQSCTSGGCPSGAPRRSATRTVGPSDVVRTRRVRCWTMWP